MSEGRSTYDIEPRRGTPPVLCDTCCEEIEAFAGVTVHGLVAGYDWRHVHDGAVECTPAPRRVRPYDDYDAERALKAASS